MSDRFRDLLDQWREADRRASEAQASLTTKFLAFVGGKGPEPTEAERSDAHRLRELADAALEVALGHMKANANSSR